MDKSYKLELDPKYVKYVRTFRRLIQNLVKTYMKDELLTTNRGDVIRDPNKEYISRQRVRAAVERILQDIVDFDRNVVQRSFPTEEQGGQDLINLLTKQAKVYVIEEIDYAATLQERRDQFRREQKEANVASRVPKIFV